MLETIKIAAVINAFWFSLPIIGYALVLFASKQTWWKYGQELSRILLRQHIFAIAVVSLAVTVGLFSAVAIPLYIFHMDVVVPVALYLLLVSLSIIYFVILGARRLFSTKNIDVFGLNNQTLLVKLLFLGLCALLVADLFITILLVPAFPWGDGIFHMARVVNILGEGFNIQSSFFNSLPEGGYLYNVIYVLYAIPAKLFGVEPIVVWEYSLGFFRLVLWLSIFTLIAHVMKNWFKETKHWMLFSTVGLMSAISVYSAQFFTANYPSKLVIVWIILLFICLSFDKKKQIKLVSPLIVGLSFLIATTHTTYALIAGCFMAALIVVRMIIMKRAYIAKWILIPQIISIVILLVGPLIAKLMPVRATQDLIEVANISTTSVFNMTILTPKLPPDLMTWIVAVSGITATIVVFIILLRRKLVYQASLLAVAALLYPILVYTPPIFTLFNALMPSWLIQRFSAIDVFVFLSTTFIAYSIYKLIPFLTSRSSSLNRETSQEVMTRVSIVLIVVILGIFSVYSAKPSYAALMEGREDKIKAYDEFKQTSSSFSGIFKDNDIVVSSPTHSYYLNALFDIDILATEYGHSPLAADGANRDLCRIEVLQGLRYVDLKAIGTDYVVLSPYEDMSRERGIANEADYLKLIASNQYYVVYKFIVNDDPMSENEGAIYKPCLEYQQVESR